MEIKEISITLINTTAAEVSAVMKNIQDIQSGSVTRVEAETKVLNFSSKKPVEEPEEEQEEEEATTKEKAKRTRRTKAELEADKKSSSKKGKEPEHDEDPEEEQEEEEKPSKRKSVSKTESMPNLVQKLAETAEELIEIYEPGHGEIVLKKILKTYGVSTISDVAPADRVAVLQTMRDKIDE